jgi:hypothetical protein
MAENKRWTKVGSILENKAKTGKYFKVDADVTLTKGQMLTIMNPRKRPGITEEQLAKIPDFVVAELFIPPAKE